MGTRAMAYMKKEQVQVIFTPLYAVKTNPETKAKSNQYF